MTYHISDVLPRVIQDLAKRPNFHYMVMKASDRLPTPHQTPSSLEIKRPSKSA